MAIFQRDLEREGVLAIEKPMNYRLKKIVKRGWEGR